MKTCLIVNPNAGSAGRHDQLQGFIEERTDVICRQTTGEGDAELLVQKALDEGAEQIGIAGGDGTVNEVINGLMRHESTARLGVIPLGTGNDLARTLAIPNDPGEAFLLLETGETQTLDVINVAHEGLSRFCINMAAGGFSGQVDEMLDEDMKKSWGPLAYLLGAANVLPDLQDYDTFITYEDGPQETVDLLNVVVANGRTAAGGKRVAPMANPQDGLLDVVIVEQCTITQLAEVGVRLMAGNYQDSRFVRHRRARRVHVAARPGLWFNVDGELLTKEPLTFTVVPGALRFVVGPDYQAEPDQGD